MRIASEARVTWKSEERQRFCVEERLIDGDYEPMYQLRQMLQIYMVTNRLPAHRVTVDILTVALAVSAREVYRHEQDCPRDRVRDLLYPMV